MINPNPLYVYIALDKYDHYIEVFSSREKAWAWLKREVEELNENISDYRVKAQLVK